MRTSLADPEFPELPLGRLDVRTIQRVTNATVVHHRAGPWARCTEDLARVVRIVTERRPAAELAAPPALHRRTEAASA